MNDMDNYTIHNDNLQKLDDTLNSVSFAAGLGDPHNLAAGDDKHFTVSWVVSLRYRRTNEHLCYTKSVLLEADKLTVDGYRRQIADLANNYGLATSAIVNTVHILGLEYLAQGLDCEAPLFKLKMLEYRARYQQYLVKLVYQLADRLEFDTFLNMCSRANLNGQGLLNNKGNDGYEFLTAKDVSYHLLADFFNGRTELDFRGSGIINDIVPIRSNVQICHTALKEQIYAIKNNLACNVSAVVNWAHIHGAIVLNELHESRKDSAGYWLNLYEQKDKAKDYKDLALIPLSKLQTPDKFAVTCASVDVDPTSLTWLRTNEQKAATEADRDIGEWLNVLLAEQNDRSLDTVTIRAKLIEFGAISASGSDWANVRQLAARCGYTTDKKGVWSLPN